MAINDINQMFSIVDPQSGKPTDYLMRLLRDRGITSDDLVTTVSDLNDAVNLIDGTVFTAGTGLSGGGVLGTDDPITFNLSASIDQLTDVDTTTTVPTNGQALVWNSTSSLWVPGSVASGGGGGGSLELIQTLNGNGAATSLTFSAIAADYEELYLVAELNDGTATGNTVITLNGDTASNYEYGRGYAGTSQNDDFSNSTTSFGPMVTPSSAANEVSTFIARFPNYTNPNAFKNMLSIGHQSVASGNWAMHHGGLWRSTAVVTSITVTGTHAFTATTRIRLYGLRAGGGGGGGSSEWTLINQTGAATTGSTWTYSTPVANVDVTGLGSWNELLIIAKNVSTAAGGNVRGIYASVDGGTTFYTTSGNYADININGTNTNNTVWFNHGTATTSGRNIYAHVKNLKGVEKLVKAMNGGVQRVFTASTSDVNAIRLRDTAGVNLTGGTLHVYAR